MAALRGPVHRPASGCENHSENQYLLKAYLAGLYEACTRAGLCGEHVVDR